MNIYMQRTVNIKIVLSNTAWNELWIVHTISFGLTLCTHVHIRTKVGLLNIGQHNHNMLKHRHICIRQDLMSSQRMRLFTGVHPVFSKTQEGSR